MRGSQNLWKLRQITAKILLNILTLQYTKMETVGSKWKENDKLKDDFQLLVEQQMQRNEVEINETSLGV